MGLENNAFAASYTSFSGVDMIATFDGVQIAELQGVSYSVSREKAPIYTMGSANPRSFSRGKRGISGSVVFIVFDRSVLISRLALGGRSKFIANESEAAIYSGSSDPSSISDESAVLDLNGNVTTPASIQKSYTEAWYADQIPPFDIVIQAANEYGHTARMVIRGVEILNTGSGMSIDDITTDESHTFVARAIKPWHLQKKFNGTGYISQPYADA